jgi:hypothetical protein
MDWRNYDQRRKAGARAQGAARDLVSSNVLAKLIDAQSVDLAEMTTFTRLLAMRERETRMLTHLATKMRLTQQAQMHPRSAVKRT